MFVSKANRILRNVAYPAVSQETPRILPNIEFLDSHLMVNNTRIDLGRKKTLRSLIHAFQKQPNSTLSTNNLALQVYGCQDLSERSKRYQKSMQARVTRLVSRARVYINNQIPQAEGEPWIEFFQYRSSYDDYVFFCLTNSYLAKIERKIFNSNQ